LPFWSPEPLP